MNKKIAKRSLALGALMAFVITGSAMAGEELNINQSAIEKDSLTITTTDKTWAVYGHDNNKLTVSGDTWINISKDADLSGFYLVGGSKIQLGGDSSTTSVTVKTKDGEVPYNGNILDVPTRGIYAKGNVDATIKGLAANFNVICENDAAYAVYAGNKSKINLDTVDTEITVYGGSLAVGIAAYSGSEVNVTGDLNVSTTAGNDGAAYALITRGNAKTYINSDSASKSLNNKVVLNGDIVFADGTDAGNDNINASVNINLDGKESAFTGGIYTIAIDCTETNRADEVTGMKLALDNGATWNVTKDSFVNTLSGNGGNIIKADGATDDVITLTVYGTVDASGKAVAGSAIKNVNLSIADVDLVIDTKKDAIRASSNTINSNSDVTIKSEGRGIHSYGIQNIKAANVTFNTKDDAIFIASEGGEHNKGEATIFGNERVTLTSEEGYAIANTSTQSSKVNVQGKEIEIISKDRAAVKVGGNYIDGTGYNGIVNIGNTDEYSDTSKITIKGVSNALGVDSEGKSTERKNSVIYTQAGETNIIANDKVEITATSGSKAIGAYGNSTLNIDGGKKTVINGSIYADGRKYGLNSDNKIVSKDNGKADEVAVDIKGKEITINANGHEGVFARSDYAPKGDSVIINLGTENTQKITINDAYIGLWADYNGSKVKVKGAELNITNNDADEAYSAICAMNGTIDYEDPEKGDNPDDGNLKNNAQVIIGKDTKTSITMKNTAGEYAGTGIVVLSQGVLDIAGDLEVHAGDALYVRGYSNAKINQENDKNITVQLDGNIDFGYEKETSGTPVDANVVINLSNEKSYLDGNIIVTGNDIPEGYDKVTGMNLGISNGAKWITNGNVKSLVNVLTMSDGIINQNSTEAITINKFNGSGNVNFASNSGHLHIDSGSGTLKLSMDSATDFNDVAAKLGVSQAVKDTNSVTAQVVLAEGVVTGETTADVTYAETAENNYYHGKVEKANIHESVNTTNAGFSDAVSLSLAAWRNSNDDMNKRLGELRDANGEHGVWVRMVRGESEYDSADYQANTYQLGYDQKAGDWTVGAAVSYTEGEGGFTNGSAEAENRGFSVYGSKLNGDGSYIDLVAKYARLDNELTTKKGVGSADYDTDGYAVSAEYGKRFAQSNGLWLEPQVQLTYGTVDSASFTTENGAKVNQDSFDSWVGRIGLRAGMDVKGGNVYARASYLYDFDGEASYTFADAANSRTIEDDLGGGWWEVGVGANINLSKATYIYADVEKTFGGEVDTNWQWNLGVRYSF